MKNEKYQSRLLGAVHEAAQDLHKIKVIDKRRMREYDFLCIEPVSAYSAEQIRSLRERYRLSQTVMASVLNVSVSTIQKWELGDKRPAGPSLKLLSILDRKGLDVLR
ncbi:MAG: DNA-binding transcriptional regulator [Chitinophagales bacterium]|jgi:putative transcriptional regulator|nr:DNA-binding transcriptional regulator [Chitinophagales bacterium]